VVSDVESEAGRGVRIESSWTCHVHNPKHRTGHVFFGRYEHLLRPGAQGWLIAAKKIVLMNDVIPTMLDFYCV
jgi:benzoate/toluate 1,2-dioxygenase beta subunit/2,4,5-trichlorophenoxyacetic acid oxygenase 2